MQQECRLADEAVADFSLMPCFVQFKSLAKFSNTVWNAGFPASTLPRIWTDSIKGSPSSQVEGESRTMMQGASLPSSWAESPSARV